MAVHLLLLKKYLLKNYEILRLSPFLCFILANLKITEIFGLRLKKFSSKYFCAYCFIVKIKRWWYCECTPYYPNLLRFCWLKVRWLSAVYIRFMKIEILELILCESARLLFILTFTRLQSPNWLYFGWRGKILRRL